MLEKRLLQSILFGILVSSAGAYAEPEPTKQGKLPNELYGIVLDYSDPTTFQEMRGVSRHMRSLVENSPNYQQALHRPEFEILTRLNQQLAATSSGDLRTILRISREFTATSETLHQAFENQPKQYRIMKSRVKENMELFFQKLISLPQGEPLADLRRDRKTFGFMMDSLELLAENPLLFPIHRNMLFQFVQAEPLEIQAGILARLAVHPFAPLKFEELVVDVARSQYSLKDQSSGLFVQLLLWSVLANPVTDLQSAQAIQQVFPKLIKKDKKLKELVENRELAESFTRAELKDQIQKYLGVAFLARVR